jgi:GTP cyclohydrolase I
VTVATKNISYDTAVVAARVLLSYIGEDVDRPGLQETPGRFIRAWRNSWGAGYRMEPPALKTFDGEGHIYDQMVLVRKISFTSHCEHHLALFSGSVDIAYIPRQGRVVGLSKLARVVEYFSRRLQVQERLTDQIADYIADGLSPDVAVLISATHSCMTTRGCNQPGSLTTTSALRGALKNEDSCRLEFLRLVGAP